jgi:hypothetical protein
MKKKRLRQQQGITKAIYSISKNVNIMMLRVMTLTIVTHCIQNCRNRSTKNKDGKNMKKGLGVSNSSQFKGKTISKVQINSMIKATVVMWPLHKTNLLGWRN